MVTIRSVNVDEVRLARDLHNRFTAQDKSLETVKSWYEAVPSLFLFPVEGDEVIGVTTGRPQGEHEVSLAGIGVEPNRRGEGIGSQLIGRFEEYAREAAIERISVASAGGTVDDFYINNGFTPVDILVMDPSGGPADYDGTDFKIAWDRNEDGSRKCYVNVTEYDPAVLEAVREEFNDDNAIYIMEKELPSQ